MLPTQTPLEYIYRQGFHLLVPTTYAESATRVLLSTDPNGHALTGGRGGAMRVAFGNGEAVLRPHRRGGLVRLLVHDAYLFSNRPRAEFLAHCKAHAAGAPVPEPLGVRWQRSGLLFRGAMMTRYLDAQPLSLAAAASPGDDAPHRLAGAAVAALHAAGVSHADLNAHNILVDSTQAWVVDLDRARVVQHLTSFQRARNLLRLRRSYAKLGIPAARFDAFLEGYGPIAIPPVLRALYRLRRAAARKHP